jgi:hypothetical protein
VSGRSELLGLIFWISEIAEAYGPGAALHFGTAIVSILASTFAVRVVDLEDRQTPPAWTVTLPGVWWILVVSGFVLGWLFPTSKAGVENVVLSIILFMPIAALGMACYFTWCRKGGLLYTVLWLCTSTIVNTHLVGVMTK